MDTQIILGLGEALIGLLLTMNIFWMKKFIKTVETLVVSVNNIEKENAGRSAGCNEKHISINARLKAHDNEISDNKEDISDLKTRVTVIERSNEKHS